jgi:hypothetical protein
LLNRFHEQPTDTSTSYLGSNIQPSYASDILLDAVRIPIQTADTDDAIFPYRDQHTFTFPVKTIGAFPPFLLQSIQHAIPLSAGFFCQQIQLIGVDQWLQRESHGRLS